MPQPDARADQAPRAAIRRRIDAHALAHEPAGTGEDEQVADGVFDAMNVDDVAPLLMLPIGLALRNAA